MGDTQCEYFPGDGRDDVTLQCKTGSMYVTGSVMWTSNSSNTTTPLIQNSKYVINTDLITIVDSTASDEGVYKCTYNDTAQMIRNGSIDYYLIALGMYLSWMDGWMDG